MEKCKFCGAELEEEVTLCPACGKDNAQQDMEETVIAEAAEETEEVTVFEEADREAPEAEQEPAEEAEEAAQMSVTPKKIALSVVAIVLLLAIIAGLLVNTMKPVLEVPADTTAAAIQGTIPPDGDPEDVTCKGSYTGSDEEAVSSRETVVATIGDKTLTNAQLQVYYWNYVNSFMGSSDGYQVVMYGMLDLSQPLDTQICPIDPTVTWQQYFLRGALENWHCMQALSLVGEAEGYTVTPENQAALAETPAALEDTAVQLGMANVEELLASEFGAGITIEEFLYFENLYYHSIPYYNDEAAKLTATAEEIEAHFTEHEAEYAELGLLRTDKVVDVRHILIMPEGATNETLRTETFPEEAWAASETRALEILKEYQEGEQTEERFGELANTYTQDGNDSNYDGIPDGGLYTGVTVGQMVPEFEAWCFEDARVPGDTDIVKTDYGYHIMYFVKGEPMWPMYVEMDILAQKKEALIRNALELHPIEVDYKAIELAAVILN